jgi:hypothetical protein
VVVEYGGGSVTTVGDPGGYTIWLAVLEGGYGGALVGVG